MVTKRDGPPPKPAHIRLLNGTPASKIRNHNEPKARDILPVVPDNITEDVRAVWDETLRELVAMHTAHAADRESLHCYCEAVVTHRRASELLGKSSLVIKGQKNNLVRNPILQIQRDAATVIRHFANEFGLTPASRTRIEVRGSESGAEENNPFAAGAS
jgi:P27 family predicted phage terminase small subunit